MFPLRTYISGSVLSCTLMVDLTLLIVQDYDALVPIGLRTLLKEQGPKGIGQKNATR